MNPVGTLETAKAVNPLKELLKYGQSVWLDYIRRNLITSGELQAPDRRRRPARHDLEPAIFEKAITGSTDYQDFLDSLKSQDRPRRQGSLRAARHSRHPGRGRPAASRLRQHQA